MIKNNYYGTNYGKANIMVSIRQKKKKTIVYCMLSKIMIHEREIFLGQKCYPNRPTSPTDMSSILKVITTKREPTEPRCTLY